MMRGQKNHLMISSKGGAALIGCLPHASPTKLHHSSSTIMIIINHSSYSFIIINIHHHDLMMRMGMIMRLITISCRQGGSGPLGSAQNALTYPELQKVKYFTRSKLSKPNFTPKKI